MFTWHPSKNELLPSWDIKTRAGPAEAAAPIVDRFERYRDADEFPGMDLARKYLG